MTSHHNISPSQHEISECFNIALPTWLIHDLLQPINAFALLIPQIQESIQDSLDNDEHVAKAWDLMNRAIVSHEHQLQNLRIYWQIKSNKIMAERKPMPIASVINDVVDLYRTQMPELEFIVDGPNDAIIESNSDCMRIILKSIIENSIQFCKQCITVSWHMASEQIRIEITDDGVGFSEHSLRHIGTPFYRSVTSAKKTNLGLGIFISNELAKKLGHSIVFPSTVGARCSISIFVEKSNRRYVNDLFSRDLLQGAKILLIDNNEKTDQLLCGLLGSWGCSVKHIAEASDVPPQKPENDYQIIIISQTALEQARNIFPPPYFLTCTNHPPLFILADSKSEFVHSDVNKFHILRRPLAPTRLRRIFENSIHDINDNVSTANILAIEKK